MNAVKQWIADVIAAIAQYFEQAMQWVWDVLTYLPLYLWHLFTDAVVGVVASIPVPNWMQNVNIFSGIPPAMSYFLQGFAVPEGIAILGASLLIRFLIRRIPIIG